MHDEDGLKTIVLFLSVEFDTCITLYKDSKSENEENQLPATDTRNDGRLVWVDHFVRDHDIANVGLVHVALTPGLNGAVGNAVRCGWKGGTASAQGQSLSASDLLEQRICVPRKAEGKREKTKKGNVKRGAGGGTVYSMRTDKKVLPQRHRTISTHACKSYSTRSKSPGALDSNKLCRHDTAYRGDSVGGNQVGCL